MQRKSRHPVNRPDPVERERSLTGISLEEDRTLPGVEVLDVEQVLDVVAVGMGGQRVEAVETEEDADERRPGRGRARGCAPSRGGRVRPIAPGGPGPEPGQKRAHPCDGPRRMEGGVAHLPEGGEGESGRKRKPGGESETARAIRLKRRRGFGKRGAGPGHTDPERDPGRQRRGCPRRQLASPHRVQGRRHQREAGQTREGEREAAAFRLGRRSLEPTQVHPGRGFTSDFPSPVGWPA